MEDSEEKKECAIGLCHNVIEAWQSVCEECHERYREEQAWSAELEEAEMEWQAEEQRREAEEAVTDTTRSGRHESK